MDAFMVVATFIDDTEMSEVFAVVAEEQARVKVLEAEGKISSIHLSLARGTVFIETHAENAQEAELTIQSLPMAKWWKLEIFPLAPAQNEAAQS
ncbi:MAG: muconolactone Delta-isomerase family protein [Actinomycetota bacterium]